MTNVKTQALLTGVALGPIAGSDPSTAGPSPQGKVWLGYCTFAARLHHRKELTKFLDELRAGRCSDVEDRELFELAAALVVAAAEAGLRVPDWGSPPSAEELGSPTWVAGRVVTERANQEAAGRRKRWGQGLARALGEPRPPGTWGTINPVYLQKSKHSLEELARRLRQALERPGFQREWLDHRSPNYVPVGKGGISNKQVTIMAGLITGRQEPRSFDETWAIVTNWLLEQHAKQPRPEDAA
jgi:hypothetical protein